MLLKNKVAVIYGAGGAVGSAVGAAFAKEGATVFLYWSLSSPKLQAVVRRIVSDGGVAEAAEVDALEEAPIEKHLDSVVSKAGGIDISFNAIGVACVVGCRPRHAGDSPDRDFYRELHLYDYDVYSFALCDGSGGSAPHDAGEEAGGFIDAYT